MKKALIVTMHSIINYGSFYQTIATMALLRNVGCDSDILDYRPLTKRGCYFLFSSLFEEKFKIKRLISDIIYFPSKFCRLVRFRKQQKMYYSSTRIFRSYDDVKKANLKYDIYLTGSDQVWNPVSNHGLDPVFFLDFLSTEKKIAFSASIGEECFSEKQIERLKSFLCNYNAISVREKSAMTFINETCGVDSIVSLDPTLMIPSEEWKNILPIDHVKLPLQKYVLAYILGRENRVMKYAKKIAAEKGLQIVKIGGALIKNPPGVINRVSIDPVAALAYFKNAEYVVSNSFHGTALSIAFNRQFITTSNALNSRFSNILSLCGLEDRFVVDDFDIKRALSIIDYNEVNSIVNYMRRKSYCFLEKAINS